MSVSCSTRQKRHRNATNESKAVWVDIVALERESRERKGMFLGGWDQQQTLFGELVKEKTAGLKGLIYSNSRKMLSISPKV